LWNYVPADRLCHDCRYHASASSLDEPQPVAQCFDYQSQSAETIQYYLRGLLIVYNTLINRGRFFLATLPPVFFVFITPNAVPFKQLPNPSLDFPVSMECFQDAEHLTWVVRSTHSRVHSVDIEHFGIPFTNFLIEGDGDASCDSEVVISSILWLCSNDILCATMLKSII